ncbi:polysaccharide deacetylase family protein [Celeribacter halophilus]|uniref:Chitooligosaccharide deacetylase n=1 Tax=Celeribacter halophilus TaxID=576117 RepID=A0A1I3NND5_9RHOB|nr:polysaccharide deacetylase family protein [Celeribacter halophilus]PZX14580.1 polysaccharide deacetylase [Celeribacter halophilus]SFJ10823.1 Polysaccharide deacetylase [Celeribacter halophilus]
MTKEILVGFGIDVDAVAGWLGSYGGEDSPDDISRGVFAGEVGAMRLLDLFDKLDIKTTWFIPGHSAETFPEQMAEVAKRGHEIGVHGYSHENPITTIITVTLITTTHTTPIVITTKPLVLRSFSSKLMMV